MAVGAGVCGGGVEGVEGRRRPKRGRHGKGHSGKACMVSREGNDGGGRGAWYRQQTGNHPAATLLLDAALVGGAGPLLMPLLAAPQPPRRQAAAPPHCPQRRSLQRPPPRCFRCRAGVWTDCCCPRWVCWDPCHCHNSAPAGILLQKQGAGREGVRGNKTLLRSAGPPATHRDSPFWLWVSHHRQAAATMPANLPVARAPAAAAGWVWAWLEH